MTVNSVAGTPKKNRGLPVCPLSLLVFITTVIVVTRQKQKRRQQQQNQPAPISQTIDPSTTDNTVPLYVVFVLGPPGVGKGTQCQLVSQRLRQQSWVHLSAGDLLRAERAKGSTLAQEINQYIDAGQLVPSYITCQLLINAMIEAYRHNNQSQQQQPHTTPVTHFLIDGFPRSQNNLDAWNAMTTVSDNQETNTTKIPKFTYHVQFVLNYTCPEETLIGRILERGKTQSRTDDNITTIQARFRTFDKETKPVLEYYQTLYKDNNSDSDTAIVPVYTIPTDQPVEAVYQQTIQYFQN